MRIIIAILVLVSCIHSLELNISAGYSTQFNNVNALYAKADLDVDRLKPSLMREFRYYSTDSSSNYTVNRTRFVLDYQHPVTTFYLGIGFIYDLNTLESTFYDLEGKSIGDAIGTKYEQFREVISFRETFVESYILVEDNVSINRVGIEYNFDRELFACYFATRCVYYEPYFFDIEIRHDEFVELSLFVGYSL
jgi:hypothetical protein